MTNNFKILKDFTFSNSQEEICNYIEQIENSISNKKNKEFHSLFINGRLILETLLSEYSNDENEIDKHELHSLIKNFVDLNVVPTKVKNAFYTIKSEANNASHIPVKSDKPYFLRSDKYSLIEFLKQLFISLKFFVMSFSKEWNTSPKEDYIFDSSIYEKDRNKDVSLISKEDISPNSDSIVSKTKGIFELICSSYNFLIPTYQRSYTWDQENVSVFLQDITDRKEDKKKHYLGSLAIAVDEEHKLLRLIDGQQRITTSLLLIKAMINRFKKEKSVLAMPIELEDLTNKLSEKYINKSSSFGDMAYIKRILKGFEKFEDKDFQKSKVYKNFVTISQYINEQQVDEFQEFYTTFVCNFVVAELKFKNELDQEIQIFENLNSKGMALSQWALIKNYIFKNLNTSFLIEHENEVEHLIKNMFEIHASTYFQDKNKIYEALSKFFGIYCRIKYKDQRGKVLNDKGKIHKIFQNVWPSEKTKFSTNKIDDLILLKKELLEIAKYLSIYLEIESGNYKDNASSPFFEFKLPIENTSEKDVHYPLIMKAFYMCSKFQDFKIYKIESKHVEDLLKLNETIEKYLTRLIVTNNKGQSLGQFFDKNISDKLKDIYKSFIDNIRIPGLSNSLPSLNDFEKSLEEKNNWPVPYAISVLRRLEAMDQNIDNKRFSIILKSSLEHIFPKTYKNTFWRKFYTDLSDKDFKDKHSSHLDMIGNYIILSQKLNSKSQNVDFFKKRLEYEKDKESKLINGQFASMKIMNLLEKENFTFSDIKERSKQLAELIVPLYKMEFE